MYLFGITYGKPTKAEARRWHRICVEEGGEAYHEVNRTEGDSPEINHGRYQGWFSAPNMGEPFDSNMKRRILARIAKAD